MQVTREEQVDKFVNKLLRDIKKVEKSLQNQEFFEQLSKFDNARVMGMTTRTKLVIEGGQTETVERGSEFRAPQLGR